MKVNNIIVKNEEVLLGGGKIFFTSDMHFNQQRSFDLSLRKMYFKDLKESTEEIVKRWNSKVNDKDYVFVLGDFGDYNVAKQLNGNIILLYGDYERSKDVPPTEEQEQYFFKIIKDKLSMIAHNNKTIILTHEPENMRLVYGFDFCLFGHIHEKQKVKREGLNVGVDVHNFYPIDFETIDFYMNAIEHYYDENVFGGYYPYEGEKE